MQLVSHSCVFVAEILRKKSEKSCESIPLLFGTFSLRPERRQYFFNPPPFLHPRTLLRIPLSHLHHGYEYKCRSLWLREQRLQSFLPVWVVREMVRSLWSMCRLRTSTSCDIINRSGSHTCSRSPPHLSTREGCREGRWRRGRDQMYTRCTRCGGEAKNSFNFDVNDKTDRERERERRTWRWGEKAINRQSHPSSLLPDLPLLTNLDLSDSECLSSSSYPSSHNSLGYLPPGGGEEPKSHFIPSERISGASPFRVVCFICKCLNWLFRWGKDGRDGRNDKREWG